MTSMLEMQLSVVSR